MIVHVLIPVLDRPERVKPLLDSLTSSARPFGAPGDGPGVRPVFLCTHGDDLEIAAVRESGYAPIVCPWPATRGDYARKINLGMRNAADGGASWALLAADDLRFHPGWLDAALACHAATHACVIGTNDMGNQRVTTGAHSTHTLVHVDYLECGTIDDGPGLILHEGYSHNFCNPPDAPILMGDCTFRPLGEVSVGDTVVGWERLDATPAVGAPRRSLCYSTVLGIAHRRAPLVRVVLESGREVRCTPDHRWLNAHWAPSSAAAAEYVTATVGRSLVHVVSPSDPIGGDLARTAGWLAGIYDGEGSGAYVATQCTDKNPGVVGAIHAALDALAIPYSYKVRPSGIAEFVLVGGRQGYMDFLQRVQPVRRDALAAHVLGWRTRESSRRDRAPIGARRFGRRDRVVAVEHVADEAEVVSLTTTSGNYVAWGYCSRNCDDELVATAQHRETWAVAGDSRIEHLHPHWRKARDDATYRRGQRHFGADRVLFNARAPLWAGSWRT